MLHIYIIGVIVLLFLAVFFYEVYFLRNPHRVIPDDKKGIVSPADGRVIRVVEFDEGSINYLKGIGSVDIKLDDIAKKGYLISIFMGPLDVHYNRSPVEGKIVNQEYKKGGFNPAFRTSSFLKNEQNEITIQGNHKIKVVQVAGIIARKIKSYVFQGQKVEKGQQLGLIKLGSQVTLVIPKELKPKIKKGDKLKAGESIIAD